MLAIILRWAGSFDELLTLDSPRTDAPMHLPQAPKPAHGHNHHSCGGPTGAKALCSVLPTANLILIPTGGIS